MTAIELDLLTISDTKKILTDFQGVQEFAFLTKFRLKWHLENAIGKIKNSET